MVKINWSEELTGGKPEGKIEMRFCSAGAKYMKYIMTFILWIDTTVGGNIYYRIENSAETKIHCSFETDELTLKKIHNRFRTLVRKHYRKDK